MRKLIQYLLVLFGIHLFMISCSQSDQFRFEEGIVWNTAYHITYQSEKDFSDSINVIFNEIDKTLSPFNKESTVSKINDNRSQDVDDHFMKVYTKSVEINQQTGGAFDPTLGPLIRAWGFGQGHEISSTDTLHIDSLLYAVGITKTELKDGKLLKSDPKIEFNFSALAKGYGVDCIADMFTRNGVTNYLVEVGGEIRASGHNAKGNKWGIGIDKPEENSRMGETVLNIYVDSCAVATSGNYRNIQQVGSNKFGHTLSPVTGRPVKTDVISATITAPTCMEADALATSCMVLGSKKALELCSGLNVGVMLITDNMTVKTNVKFEKLMK